MREPLRLIVAAEIRAELARRQISGAALAKALGVSGPWVSRRLNGEGIDLDDLDRISDYLGVPATHFLAPERAA